MCIRDRYCIRSVGFFLQFKKRITKSYPEIFIGADGGVDLSATGNFATKWGWFQSLYSLAQGDIRRLGNISELRAHECFLMLAFEKEKIELENQLLNKK